MLRKRNMKEDQELKMLLDEIPYLTSLNLHHLHPPQSLHVPVNGGHGYNNHMLVSPIGISLRSDGSSSSSFFCGHCSSDDGLATPSEITSQLPYGDVCYLNRPWLESNLPGSTSGRNSGNSLTNELGLAECLRRMHISGGNNDSSIETFKVETPHRCPSDNHIPIGTDHGRLGQNGSFEQYRKEFLNHGGLQCSSRAGPSSSADETSSTLFRLQREGRMSSLSGLNISSDTYSRPPPCSDLLNFPCRQMEQNASNETSYSFFSDSAFGKNLNDRGTHLLNVAPSLTKDFSTDDFLYSQRTEVGSSQNRDMLSPKCPSQLRTAKMPLDAEGLNSSSHSLPIFTNKAPALPDSWVAQYLPSIRSSPNIETFNCEDGLIIQGKGLHSMKKKGAHPPRGNKNIYSNDSNRGQQREKSSNPANRSHIRQVPTSKHANDHNSRIYPPSVQPLKSNYLIEVQGNVYSLAKDHCGCRFLQQKFDDGTAEDVEMIFNEIIEHVVELMMNSFGNYLIQKLLDVCTEEQRMQILLMVTQEPGLLVRISLDNHGTRVVQKLIETLKTKQQILMVTLSLEPGILYLINNLNGNHVVQRCLQCLSSEDNKFIFKAAAKYSVTIATHQHGCCVLQRCIDYSTGEHREKLVAEISTNGFLLAQDAFGNYVVQYILKLNNPTAIANLISQFEGNYVHLSTQKFSSNVVETCLKEFGDKDRSKIVHELLSYSHFEHLLQDPFANYVIQCALGVTKGLLHASLVEAIRKNAAVLHTSPYCKRLLSRAILKK